jgi:hypothetical protein
MLNTFRDATFAPGGLRNQDGYIGFNPVYSSPAFSSSFTSPALSIPARCGGAILFDGAGRMSVRPYRLMLHYGVTTELAKALTYDRELRMTSNLPIVGKTCKGNAIETYSSVGFILFDQAQFRDVSTVTVPPGSGGQSYPITTPPDQRELDGDLAGNPNAPTEFEKAEEAWIDQNGTPYLVARHSGALLRTK